MAKYFILTLSIAAIIFAACNKKATPSATNHMDWLRSGKWKVSSGTLSVKKPNGKDTALNYLDWIPQCHKDDYIVFNTATTGAVFNGPVSCTPGDADSISFAWNLSNSDNYLTIHNSYHLYYSVFESILPLAFDTVSQSPLELDTIFHVADTPFLNPVIELDSIWRLHFDSTAVLNTVIDNGVLTNFTENSFTVYYTLKAQYPDSTGWQTGRFFFTNPGGFPDSADNYTKTLVDTFKYKITYTKF